MTISVTGCSTCRRVFISRNEEAAVAVEQELDGAGADVADGARGGDGGVAHARAQVVVDGGGGRLLDDLLVAALDACSRARTATTTLPCVSANTWISTWRPPST